ncbi:MAG: hypothetical protein WAT25_07610, partial [Paracoccaceae bacterium]
GQDEEFFVFILAQILPRGAHLPSPQPRGPRSNPLSFTGIVRIVAAMTNGSQNLSATPGFCPMAVVGLLLLSRL